LRPTQKTFLAGRGIGARSFTDFSGRIEHAALQRHDLVVLRHRAEALRAAVLERHQPHLVSPTGGLRESMGFG
jgi:hypothetical protein